MLKTSKGKGAARKTKSTWKHNIIIVKYIYGKQKNTINSKKRIEFIHFCTVIWSVAFLLSTSEKATKNLVQAKILHLKYKQKEGKYMFDVHVCHSANINEWSRHIHTCLFFYKHEHTMSGTTSALFNSIHIVFDADRISSIFCLIPKV